METKRKKIYTHISAMEQQSIPEIERKYIPLS